MAIDNPRFTLVDHPLVAHKIGLIRDKDTSSALFRRLVREVTLLEAYPALQSLPTREVEVETPLATTTARTVSGNEPVVVPILRAGLAMADALQEFLPMSTVAHLGMFRNETTHEPVVYYAKFPKDLAQRPVILVDPMLATGGSLVEAISELRRRGVKDITAMVIVASPQGVERVLEADPDVRLFSCTLDQGLNEDAYIVPGLGDAGDRIFNTLDAVLDSSLYSE